MVVKRKKVIELKSKHNARRGDIFYADLRPVTGSEQGGVRPVLIIQNDAGNKYSPTVIVAAVTSRFEKELPTHLDIGFCGKLEKHSIVLLEQVRTIDKCRLKEYVATLTEDEMQRVNEKIAISFGI